MKTRFLLISALLVSALMGCSKESNEMIDEVTPKNGSFSVLLNNSNTKTTNSGTSTYWVAGDDINMFHALAGGTSYISDGQFITSSSGSTATFTGTLASELVEGNSYDWYAIYPYDEHITTPAPISSGYSVVGSTIDGVQTQTNKDNMSHIAGVGYPIVGRATSVSAETKPTILMSNATALLKVHVTNNSASTLTVSSVVFIASEKVVGQYFIDITGAKPTFTDKSSSTSRYARLAVSGTSKDITVGSSGDFYLAVKPFTVHDGDKLSVSVNGFQRTLTVGSDQEIAAGKIKTLNFDYNPPAYDQLFYTALGITGSSYTSWSNISGTHSSAVYAGQTNGNEFNYIQMRNSSPSGIVSTTSGGSVTNVSISWNSSTSDGRKVTIYGKNTPYSGPADLYSDDTKGTELGEIEKGVSTSLAISEYYEYVGILANGALYMDEVDITWGAAKTKIAAPTNVNASETTGGTISVTWIDVPSGVAKYIVTCTGQSSQDILPGVQKADFSGLMNGTYDITIQAVPSDTEHYSNSEIVTKSDVTVSSGIASPVYTLLTSTATGGNTSPHSNYTAATDYDYTDGTTTITWNVMANSNMTPWRFGGKNITDVNRALFSKTPITQNIKKIEVESGNSTITVNSLTITVHNSADDASTGANAIATKVFTSSIANSTVTFNKEDATSWAGKFYRFVYNVTNDTSSNKYIQLSSVKFYDE